MKNSVRGPAGLLCLLTISSVGPGIAQTGADQESELRYVVYLSRHGVRSPTGKSSLYDQYSSGAWPQWTVEPGLLTAHGFHLMELFGAYDRSQLASEKLLQATGCADAAHITVYADSDQRTRETGKAIARGLLPGCELAVLGLPEGTNDPLFHPLGEPATHGGAALATAAVDGRLSGHAENLTRAYRPQLEALDRILACGKAQPGHEKTRVSLFDIPAKLSQGSGDHLVDLKGPLNTASTLAENLLLEYTEGMNKANVGWGCAGVADIAEAISLHEAATDYTQRTLEVAKAQAGTLMDRIRLSLQQKADGKPVAGAMGRPNDRVLFLVGHDTNQENMAGVLGLNWIVDGRRDDTPPGGALVFELWQGRTGSYSVRMFYTAQTLEQMRGSVPLTMAQPPERMTLFVPGCSRSDMSCDLKDFLQLLRR